MTVDLAEIRYQPIGVIHSPFSQPEGMPIQPAGARGVPGQVELLPNLAPALLDLLGFSHLILIYHLHRAGSSRLVVTPFLDDHPHGLFATRAPTRPNPIGLSVVRLTGIDGHVLQIMDVDILDGTPLLDLKPYLPAFDHPPGEVRSGWLEDSGGRLPGTRADSHFA